MNLLDGELLSGIAESRRSPCRYSLPGLLAALARGEILDFPKLRPHQRHVWHAFLVQIAALATLEGGPLPGDEAAWRDRLLALTPDHPDGAAWSLVSPPDRPAFLQPPIPGGDLGTFKRIETPDALDMLVASKQHDLKSGAMAGAEPEHWIYALVSLQTQEGFLGAGNYGISRMNGGFASRPGLGIEPEGGPGRRFVRDVLRLRELRPDIARLSFPDRGGLGLVWLEPWSGVDSLLPGTLDPFYVEICRRVRLVAEDGCLTALAAGSKAARIEAKSLKGRTGDPWTPLVPDQGDEKALTVNADGFSYRRLVPLLFPNNRAPVRKAPLQELDTADDPFGLSILARALVRGQGKTEGFHERRVPVSSIVGTWRHRVASDKAAACAHERVGDAGLLARKVLYPAVLLAITGAPDADNGERKRDDDATRARAGAVCDRFDALVDETFFDALGLELAAMGDLDAAATVRGAWLLKLRTMGWRVLTDAIDAAPRTELREWRVRVRARNLYFGLFRKEFRDRFPDDPPVPAIEEDA